jgi:hypothetical protein
MLNPFRRSLNIDISPQGIALSSISGLLRKRITAIPSTVESKNYSLQHGQLARSLQDQLAAANISHAGTSVILPDECVRFFMVTPPHNMRNLQDCRAAAEMRFRTLYDESITDWTLQADWDSLHPFLACAIPNGLLGALEEVARQRDLTLLSITPQFIAMFNLWRKKLKADAWLGAMHGNVLSLGIMSKRQLLNVRVTTLAGDIEKDNPWLREHTVRESLRLNVAIPAQIQLCGTFPAHWKLLATDMFNVDVGNLNQRETESLTSRGYESS